MSLHRSWSSSRVGFFNTGALSQDDILCDTNFNSRQMVSLESTIAEAIMSQPTEHSLKAIQRISDRLYDVLTQDSIEGIKNDTLLSDLVSSPIAKHRIYKSFLPESQQIGVLPETDAKQPVEQLILKYLSQKVTALNFILHLKISQAVSGMLYDLHKADNKTPKESLLLHTLLTKLAHRKGLDDTDTSALEKYRTLVERIYPKPKEMKGIRFQRKHTGSELTRTKGIHARDDYQQDSSSLTSIFGAHVRGSDVWRVRLTDKDSEFAAEALKNNLPLIAGASGTSARWICLLALMGYDFDSIGEDQSIHAYYTTNILGYMVACGHHSMHEIAHVFKKAGANYMIGDWYTVISDKAFPHKAIINIKNRIEKDGLNTTPTIK